MRTTTLSLFLVATGCSYVDNVDYTPEVRARAAAELHCDPSAIHITAIPDSHGTHTFVCDGCGCTATYVCAWKDFDGCEREPTLEAADASCR
jgi:hypothetical protein